MRARDASVAAHSHAYKTVNRAMMQQPVESRCQSVLARWPDELGSWSRRAMRLKAHREKARDMQTKSMEPGSISLCGFWTSHSLLPPPRHPLETKIDVLAPGCAKRRTCATRTDERVRASQCVLSTSVTLTPDLINPPSREVRRSYLGGSREPTLYDGSEAASTSEAAAEF